LRELTRHRHTLVRDQTAVSNRIIKLVESANIKLAQVASSALGVSGRAMLHALARGEQDTTKMADLARGPLREKQGQLRRALRGKLTKSQQFVLTELLDQLEQLEAAVARVSHGWCSAASCLADPSFFPLWEENRNMTMGASGALEQTRPVSTVPTDEPLYEADTRAEGGRLIAS